MTEAHEPGDAIDVADFLRVDLRVGRVLEARVNEAARVPALHLRIDFGPVLGVRESSAQLTENYAAADLFGRLVVAVVNLPPKRVAGVKSEVLVLGALSEDSGTVLLGVESGVAPGTPVR